MTLLTRTVNPTGYPVTLAEAKATLRVEHTDEDDLIEALIAAASDTIEEMVGRPLLTQTWKVSVRNPQDKVFLRAPVQSLVSITYYDPQNTQQTATVGNYLLISDDDRAWIEPGRGVDWPALYGRDDAFSVEFLAGYGAASDVPEPILRAIHMLTAHLYENREAVAAQSMTEMPLGVESLVGVYKNGWVG